MQRGLFILLFKLTVVIAGTPAGAQISHTAIQDSAAVLSELLQEHPGQKDDHTESYALAFDSHGNKFELTVTEAGGKRTVYSFLLTDLNARQVRLTTNEDRVQMGVQLNTEPRSLSMAR